MLAARGRRIDADRGAKSMIALFLAVLVQVSLGGAFRVLVGMHGVGPR